MSRREYTEKDVIADRYEVVQYVAEGGMQQVFLARDLIFERLVALKVPKNASAEIRFQRSAVLSARVNHPNVARVFDYGEWDGKSYLIEEFVFGRTLGDVLDHDFEYFDPHLAAHVFHHIVKGLAASHRVGVFHRDIKPKNVMVSGDVSLEKIKITDFGIAKLAEEEMLRFGGNGESITGSHTLVGALPYMAPEMIEAPTSAGLPADVWAVGAMLYELLVGDVPFGRGLKAVTAIVSASLPPAPQIFGAKQQYEPLCKALWAIVEQCMTREPHKRPTADVLVDLGSKLCYASALRQAGKVLRFKGGTGDWGFVEAKGGAPIFFHADSYYGAKAPQIGDRVSFSAFPGSPFDRAFPMVAMRDISGERENG
jgi:serine/threonine-protein kinase